MMKPAVTVAGLACVLGLVGGCETAPSSPLSVSAEQYPTAFQAARDVLRDADFILDRTDSQAGVLTTAIKATAGAASPWDQEQSTVGQEAEDLFNRQSRSVRVTFVPRGAGSGADPAGLADVRAAAGPMDVQVVATLYRRQRPGWRPDSTGVSLHRHWQDASAPGRGEQVVAIDEDRALADRLREQIRQRLAARAVAATTADPATPAADSGSRTSP